MQRFPSSAATPGVPLSVPWGALGSTWKPALVLGLGLFLGDALYPFASPLFPFSSRQFNSFGIYFHFLMGFEFC